MKIIIPTQRAVLLKARIFKDVEEEVLKTWVFVNATNQVRYLSHKPPQWHKKALLELIPKTDSLVILISWFKGNEPDEELKGYYIGRFVEVLLAHYRDHYANFTIEK